MPVEIRELIIRATVDPGSSSTGGSRSDADEDRRALVAECVEQVLETLRRRDER